MTTITREQQKQILIDTANHVISRDNTSPYSENLRELARIALAQLIAEPVERDGADADPVVFTDERNLHHIARGRETSLIWGKQNQEVGDIPLYRHAQPAPVVPEEIPKGLADQIVSLLAHNIGDKFLAQKIWNACRAAMLQGNQAPVKQPSSNSENVPVISDGWVMVPVELTDDMIAAAMNCDDVLFNRDESFCVQFGNIYAAMIAAAPQQEAE
ncbi:hypothetical protein AZ965_005000 [Salmonella enterica subsp. enterica serovar 4,[5],12:i:-]|uniref:Eaa protein n=15 Tax=Salmonella enterica TaxID=28901 RepID=A0A5W7BN58_SALET|nr:MULTISPECIES: hypothetical protein [Salmonella]EAA2148557.1 hypothetical protein [Salmonella enterica subsp. enterica serovar Saintpaul]EAB9437246.1 hypothetical protein [Salmonella enterica subsp. enterica serovar Typhimurium str. UK-1]EAY3299612.1 hypothetical protein [Salmonella enterica subsp. enterica serovar Dublin]EBC9894510.1 hypothetical protein [Salmonella enterica subsp. enterica serovar Agona]EBH0108002.1 hypothetical protein [Salmonella enterica subsp. enterica serovar 4:i:-]E